VSDTTVIGVAYAQPQLNRAWWHHYDPATLSVLMPSLIPATKQSHKTEALSANDYLEVRQSTKQPRGGIGSFNSAPNDSTLTTCQRGSRANINPDPFSFYTQGPILLERRNNLCVRKRMRVLRLRLNQSLRESATMSR
jgi:hypothetical protein